MNGLRFSYSVSGNELLVDRKKKAIVRSSVNVALQNCREHEWRVSGPKAMNVYGASYLYSYVFVIWFNLGRKHFWMST